MQSRKKDRKEEKKQVQDENHLRCQVCNRIVKIEECSWQEDDGEICCRDCWAERESCGCSD
jgi:hypothetical protein